MKKTMDILCVTLALLGVAYWAQARMVATVVDTGSMGTGTSYPGFTYDVYEDFENALSGSWSESDASSIIDPLSSAGKYRGTYGVSISTGSTAEGWLVYTFGSAKTTFSAGLWIKTGSYDAYAGDRWFAVVYNDAEGNLIVLREGNSAGDDSRLISWSIDSDTVTVDDNTWYWVTVKFVRNGTSQCSVYNTSGVQVGSTMSGTSTDFSADYFMVGSYGVATNTDAYYDEVFIDYADATFPLGPPSGS